MVNLKAGSRPPWVGLGAAVWVQIASGNAYNFPLYSHTLKSVLGYNQHQLTMLGVAADIGENVGLVPGIACNKFPPWLILMIGGLASFFGYGILWLAVTRTVQSLPYWLLWLALCVATNSSAWLSTAVLVTNMRNFPFSRGTVAGILKGYSGISAAVFTEVYSILLHKSSSKLLLFLALGIPALCFIVMYLVRPCTPASDEDSSEHAHFLFTQAALVVLAVFVLMSTVLDHMLHFSDPVSYTFLLVMIILLMAPLAIPIKMTFLRTRTRKSEIHEQPVESSECLLEGEGNADKHEPLLNSSQSEMMLGNFQESDVASEVAMLLAEGEGAIKKKRRPKRGEDFKLSEAVVKADFWLLFFVYFVGVGSGVTVLNNLAQIGIAQDMHNTTILLSLFSFCNFVGRLGGGIVSEHFVSSYIPTLADRIYFTASVPKRLWLALTLIALLFLALLFYVRDSLCRSRAIPRTIWMTCTQVLMIITYLLFASSMNGTLYVATALLGICYGVQFSIMIPTVSELFGLKYFGIFYNFMSIGNPLGAFLFSGLLAGYVYDSEAAKQGGLNMLLNSSISCSGPNCFRLTFLVLAGVCGVGSLLSIILTIRIKPVYQMLYAGGSFRLLPQASDH